MRQRLGAREATEGERRMTYGIDIYDRYQDITNAIALRDSPFDWAYVKGTDGGGRAPVAADQFVRTIKSIGLPVGLYHYAQLNPSPETQAQILAEEVRRLAATGLPPALDLEDPHPATWVSRAFAQRFLAELKRQGFPQVVLYANTSMLNAIRAWELDAALGGGVLIWAATYGDNDADYDAQDQSRLARAYPHPVWIHQYSSTGAVPGIPGNVDKNWMFNQNGADDMPLTQADADLVAAAVWARLLDSIDPNVQQTLPAWVWLTGANMGAWAAAQGEDGAVDVDKLAASLSASLVGPLTEAMSQLDGLDEDDAERIVQLMGRQMAGQVVAQANAA
jgi:GH25 family lysozyme M1 (1,4-beta-N-acetylmuramidase)